MGKQQKEGVGCDDSESVAGPSLAKRAQAHGVNGDFRENDLRPDCHI